MASHGWQIGIHITPNNISVIVVRRLRQSTRLQQWWLLPLTAPLFTSAGGVEQSEQLVILFEKIRHSLPTHYSLRISYPLGGVLHRIVSAPIASLSLYQRERYILTLIDKLFTDRQGLCWDYHLGPDCTKELSLVIAKSKSVYEYCAYYQQVGLIVGVVDLAASVLQTLLDGNTEQCLIVEESDFWLWAAYVDNQWRYGWYPRHDYPSISQLLAVLNVDCAIYLCTSDMEQQTLPHVRSYASLNKVAPYCAALPPTTSSLLIVALGLALRAEDRL